MLQVRKLQNQQQSIHHLHMKSITETNFNTNFKGILYFVCALDFQITLRSKSMHVQTEYVCLSNHAFGEILNWSHNDHRTITWVSISQSNCSSIVRHKLQSPDWSISASILSVLNRVSYLRITSWYYPSRHMQNTKLNADHKIQLDISQQQHN